MSNMYRYLLRTTYFLIPIFLKLKTKKKKKTSKQLSIETEKKIKCFRLRLHFVICYANREVYDSHLQISKQ